MPLNPKRVHAVFLEVAGYYDIVESRISPLARVGPTTPTRARRPFDASVDPTEARKLALKQSDQHPVADSSGAFLCSDRTPVSVRPALDGQHLRSS